MSDALDWMAAVGLVVSLLLFVGGCAVLWAAMTISLAASALSGELGAIVLLPVFLGTGCGGLIAAFAPLTINRRV